MGSRHARLQLDAVQLFCSLLSDAQQCAAVFAENGVLPALVALLQSSSGDVYEAAAEAMWRLAEGSPERSAAIIATPYAVESLVANLSDTDYCATSVHALWSIVATGRDNAAAVAAVRGALDRLFTLMFSTSWHHAANGYPIVREAAAHTLHCMTSANKAQCSAALQQLYEPVTLLHDLAMLLECSNQEVQQAVAGILQDVVAGDAGRGCILQDMKIKYPDLFQTLPDGLLQQRSVDL